METKTLEFLKKCTKLNEITQNKALNLHYKSLLEKHQSVTNGQLQAQNEHYRGKQDKITAVKNAQVECKFCFTKAVPEFQVKRQRPKGQKKLKKTLVFECKTCHKVTLPKETLPTLKPLKTKKETKPVKPEIVQNSESVDKPKKKRKKDHNAGLIIPPQAQKKSRFGANDKLKSLLALESEKSTESRLQKMLK